MSENSLLLSIIIPTKNRYSTLFIVVDSIIENLSNKFNYEIIIQDNSDDNKSCLDYLSRKKSSQIKYFYESMSIPIADNTELAIDNAKGKYMIFIGDDDFIAPDILKITNIMDEQSIKCLIYSPGYYWWNSVVFSSENYYHKSKNLWLPMVSSTIEFTKLDTKYELNKTLEKGAMAYDMLPRFYHGIVLRSEILKFKSIIGRYISGSCPDMDFAISLALSLDEHYFVNYPISVFGASKNSGGGFTALKKHFGKIEDLPFLRYNIRENWNPLIPRIWSEKTIYPQTTSEVLIAYNVKKEVNLLPLYAAMLIYTPFLEPKIYKYVIKNCRYNLIKYLKFIIEIVRKIAGFIVTKLRYRFKKLPYMVYNNVEANNVILILTNYFEKK